MKLSAARALLLCGLVLVFGATHWGIFARERLLNDGEIVLLELAPVDPRSLVQGDYMALRFRVAEAIRTLVAQGPTDGTAIVKLDPNGVGSFDRLDRSGAALAADERRLRYKVRSNEVRISTNAFFFREGTGERYRGARYGELRVGPSGEALLVALRDKDRNLLGTAR